ncbi:hypothetical protein SAMN05216359_105318 [Roseateles sp. YR242]|uniref:hypothetical protein n=1 Tax=Roseateles sp. YR242 TaxID=1855305 RepID=UPI0008C521EB|nr:hypothetical protein [Roseateles sp. YR242]SEL13330.1 hypothetical protein SAMN05216359_105318 [Roseateles sp. YR242]
MAQILSFEAAAKAKQQRRANPLGFPLIVAPKPARVASRRARAQAVHFAAKSAL